MSVIYSSCLAVWTAAAERCLHVKQEGRYSQDSGKCNSWKLLFPNPHTQEMFEHIIFLVRSVLTRMQCSCDIAENLNVLPISTLEAVKYPEPVAHAAL